MSVLIRCLLCVGWNGKNKKKSGFLFCSFCIQVIFFHRKSYLSLNRVSCPYFLPFCKERSNILYGQVLQSRFNWPNVRVFWKATFDLQCGLWFYWEASISWRSRFGFENLWWLKSAWNLNVPEAEKGIGEEGEHEQELVHFLDQKVVK